MPLLICKCGKSYSAKPADLARGWGKSCSKSCAAKKRDNSAYYAAKKRAGKVNRLISLDDCEEKHIFDLSEQDNFC